MPSSSESSMCYRGKNKYINVSDQNMDYKAQSMP